MSRPRVLAIAAGAALVALTLSACTASSEEPSMTQTAEADPGFLSQIRSMEVMGDSISLAVNACASPGPCPELSWATGSDVEVNSVASRIEELNDVVPEVANRAREGAGVADALTRVDAVVADEPDLVLVLIGANDACAPDLESITSADEFDSDVTELVTRLGSGLPRSTILMMSVPNINRLWEVHRGNAEARSIWSKSPACRSLLWNSQSDAPADQERRSMISSLVNDYNDSIERACGEVPNCITDRGAVNALTFDAGGVSALDYFHPSESSQQDIAEIAWDALVAAD